MIISTQKNYAKKQCIHYLWISIIHWKGYKEKIYMYLFPTSGLFHSQNNFLGFFWAQIHSLTPIKPLTRIPQCLNNEKKKDNSFLDIKPEVIVLYGMSVALM